MSLEILGLVLIALAVAMVVVARPADGVAAPFLRAWPIGQAYTMVTMASSVTGVALIISNWPF
jgi:hypothetical protein